MCAATWLVDDIPSPAEKHHLTKIKAIAPTNTSTEAAVVICQREPVQVRIKLRGFHPRSVGTAWTLEGTGIDAHPGTAPFRVEGKRWVRPAVARVNPRFNRGGPQEVTLSAKPVRDIQPVFSYVFPPYSVTSLEMESAAR